MGAGSNSPRMPVVRNATLQHQLHEETHIQFSFRDEFREKLIAHFTILWEKNEIVWPLHCGKMAITRF